MQTRQLHALQIKLKTPKHLSVIVWPAENREGCCRLINSKRTWMTARAGDAVLLKRQDSADYERVFIDDITLYRVYPVEFNGTVVETAQSWLAAKS